MTRAASPLQLEDFGRAAPSPPEPAPPALPDPPPLAVEGQLEGGNLDAFEQGYRSGWDDCIANEQEERRRISAGLEAALAEISASAEEIRQDMMMTLSPLLDQIATHLIPAVAAEAVGPTVVEELLRIASDRATRRVDLLAAPATCPILEHLTDGIEGLEIDILPEPAMAEEQVSLRFAGQHREIDLSEAASRMSAALRATAAEMAGRAEIAVAPDDAPKDTPNPLTDHQEGVA